MSFSTPLLLQEYKDEDLPNNYLKTNLYTLNVNFSPVEQQLLGNPPAQEFLSKSSQSLSKEYEAYVNEQASLLYRTVRINSEQAPSLYSSVDDFLNDNQSKDNKPEESIEPKKSSAIAFLDFQLEVEKQRKKYQMNFDSDEEDEEDNLSTTKLSPLIINLDTPQIESIYVTDPFENETDRIESPTQYETFVSTPDIQRKITQESNEQLYIGIESPSSSPNINRRSIPSSSPSPKPFISSLPQKPLINITLENNQKKAASKLKASTTSVEPKHWNREFWKLFKLHDLLDSSERSRLVSNLTNDFATTATSFAKIIISELCLPDSQKTIKTSDLDYSNETIKFVAQGILFKIASDYQVAGDSSMWMYGDKEPRDDLAMKAMSRKLVSATALYRAIKNNPTPNANVIIPLMAIIDYKGFRVLAVSVLPIDKTTLVYGSSDGGITAHTDDPLLNGQMERVGNFLKLKKHKSGLKESSELYGPGDIQGHKGHDGNYYLINSDRLIPPEAPIEDPEYRRLHPRSIFYNCLRPEFLLDNDTTLCSDAFSAWDLSDDKEKNKEEVREATEKLYSKIPEFVDYLENEIEKIKKVRCLDNPKDLHSICSLFELIYRTTLHPRGFNIRHLGRIRFESRTASAKRIILAECVSRVIKEMGRERMRNQMRLVGAPADEPFKDTLMNLLNEVFGTLNPKLSEEFWTKEVKWRLESKFYKVLSEQEQQTDYDLRKSLNLKHVIVRTCTHLDIKLRKETQKQVNFTTYTTFDFIFGDIKEFTMRIKYAPFIYVAQGIHITKLARKCDNLELKKRYFRAALDFFENADTMMTGCNIFAKYFGKATAELAMLCKNPIKRDSMMDLAYKRYCNNSKIITDKLLKSAKKIIEKHKMLKQQEGNDQLNERFENMLKNIEQRISPLCNNA